MIFHLKCEHQLFKNSDIENYNDLPILTIFDKFRVLLQIVEFQKVYFSEKLITKLVTLAPSLPHYCELALSLYKDNNS